VQVGLGENSASIFYKIKAVQKTGFSGTFTKIKFDALVKNRHSGENRSPDVLKVFE
jgi:hypothetical protein